MAIGALAVAIAALTFDGNTTQSNMALLVLAVAAVGGVWATSYAARNEVKR
jgi:hypothetical protein